MPIIPQVIEYTPNLCLIKFGDPIYMDHDADKTEEIQHLEDAMATLKWDI